MKQHPFNNPRLTLVGAGPGDPELVTLKAVKALQSADVVLYDALAPSELLDFAPKAIQMFVGKRRGLHSHSQQEINQLIVDMALECGHVVRLKGGDPLIFGRGSEEVEYANRFGIPTTIVPGISSSISVPANAGIPLTKRGISQSFWVITGTTSQRRLSSDIQLAAQSSATVVILMGMGKLEQIVDIYRREGKYQLPIAIIQNGTTDKEKRIKGSIGTILDLVRTSGIGNPATIVIGPVVDAQMPLAPSLDASHPIFNLPNQSIA